MSSLSPLNRSAPDTSAVNRPSLPNVTVAQLEYLVAAVEFSTWSEAARELGVSQSALSQGLAELQRRLGLELFERRGRRRVATAVAEPVIAHARRVIAQTSDLARWSRTVQSGTAGRMRIGMIDAAAIEHFGTTLRTFRDEHPELEIHLMVAPSSQLVGALARGDIDLAVCVEPDHLDIIAEPLLREPLHVYAPPDSPATEEQSWGPWVTFPLGSLTRELIGTALGDRGIDFTVVAESHQPEVLREMVQLSMGWTVLPSIQAERGDRPLSPVNTTPLLHRTLVTATRRSAVPNPAAEILSGALRDAAA